jgi:hypothetical protein
LDQTNPQPVHAQPKAVLEQPSPRSDLDHSLGRRNIALAEIAS